VENLGLPTDDFGWSLEEGSNVNEDAYAGRSRASGSEAPRTCPDCGYLWLVSSEGSRCKCCGWQPRPIPRPIPTEAARLEELGGADVTVTWPLDPLAVEFFRQAFAYYMERWPDRKPNSGRGYAWHKLRARFDLAEHLGIPGRFWSMEPAEYISPAVRGWLRAADIRWAKSRGK
jgi:hypothetical protein